MSIKAVLFDLDDTLLWDDRSVKEAFQATCAMANQGHSINPEVLEQKVRIEARALWESFETYEYTKMIGINPFEGLWANFDEGDNPNLKQLKGLVPNYRSEAWTKGLKSCGITDEKLGIVLGEAFPRERRERRYIYEETISVLQDLGKKMPLLLLTNGAPDLQKEKIEGVQLTQYFKHIVISGAFGKGKPDPSIFEYALSLLGIQPHEGIMVGDKLTTDIIGSLGVGMKSVWINRHQVKRSNEIVPDFEIKHLSEIQQIVDSLNGN
jgi:putative hydrolase of the HAD superfamily